MANDPDIVPASIGAPHQGQRHAHMQVWDDSFKNGQTFGMTDTDADYVGDKFNDQISCIEITSGTWDFFEDKLYGGTRWRLGPGYYPDLSTGDMNDKISSIRLAAYDKLDDKSD